MSTNDTAVCMSYPWVQWFSQLRGRGIVSLFTKEGPELREFTTIQPLSDRSLISVDKRQGITVPGQPRSLAGAEPRSFPSIPSACSLPCCLQIPSAQFAVSHPTLKSASSRLSAVSPGASQHHELHHLKLFWLSEFYRALYFLYINSFNFYNNPMR